jgi:hypothetical protein
MDLSPAAEAAPRRAPDDPLERPLPSMMMADASTAVRKSHGWPGTLFYGFSYFVAVALGGAALMTGIGVLTDPSPRYLAMTVGGGLWSVLQWRLAREVRHFSRWGWYGAMAEMGIASAAKVWALAQGEIVGGVVGLAFDIYVLRYFWKRRADFDIDL